MRGKRTFFTKAHEPFKVRFLASDESSRNKELQPVVDSLSNDNIAWIVSYGQQNCRPGENIE